MVCLSWCPLWNYLFASGNDYFKMEMTDAKRKLLDLKRSYCLKEIIDKTDLMFLINITWNKSFARIDKNKKLLLT